MAAPAVAPRRVATFVSQNPITGTVNTTATRVFDPHPHRLLVLAVNLSVNTGYLGFDAEVTTTRGLPIGASGGSAVFLYREDGDLVTGPIYAVNAVAGGTWFFVQVVAADLEKWLAFAFAPLGGAES